MKPKFLAAVLWLLGCLSSAAAQQVVRIATLDYPPYAVRESMAQSPAVRLTAGAFAIKGVRAEFDFLPWARAMNTMKDGKYDGLLLVWPSEIDSLGLLASDPLFHSALGVFVKAGSPLAISGPESLRGIRLGVVRGYGYPVELLAAGAQLDAVSDDQTNLKKLAAGRLDAVLLEKAVGEHLLRHELLGLCGQLAWGGKTLARLPLAIGFRNDATRLVFNAGLREFKSRRDYSAIMASLEATQAAAATDRDCGR